MVTRTGDCHPIGRKKITRLGDNHAFNVVVCTDCCHLLSEELYN